jgi:hypothetical protein
MAKNNKIARFIKSPRGFEPLPLRAGTEKSGALYLLQLRTRLAEAHNQAQLARRKLSITIDQQDSRARVVKITQT